jgi:hypothetical protein
MCRFGIGLAAILLIVSTDRGIAQETRAGLLTCDVSAGLGLILGSQKELACAFAPEGPGRHEDYGGVITKFGLDVGLIGGGVMVWASPDEPGRARRLISLLPADQAVVFGEC